MKNIMHVLVLFLLFVLGITVITSGNINLPLVCLRLRNYQLIGETVVPTIKLSNYSKCYL